ncbi:E3 ubiquitin-protein ligase bre1 [Lunasporangiospora selenospora]|uniref:E3 ubiquitin protein ligase n=1 Tax=Lunasporangiospora selenospora TaxID=979761 RepID=A0A9P6FSJ8_9FUNG|nr:E3 ubiquitin-protein ligase bre1 [Lunasporangiospora selenospora]
MDDRSIRKRRLTDETVPPNSSSSVSRIGSPSGAGASAAAVTGTGAGGSVPVISPPPNKRQFTGLEKSVGSPASNGTKEDPEPANAAEEVLLRFQKEAIWRQVQEYRRELTKTQEKINQLDDRQIDYGNHTNIVDAAWDKLLDDLKSLLQRSELLPGRVHHDAKEGSKLAIVLSEAPELHDTDQVLELTEGAIKKSVAKRSESIKDIILTLLKGVDAWTRKYDGFTAVLVEKVQGNNTIHQLLEEHRNAVRKSGMDFTEVDRLQSEHHVFSDQIRRLKNEIEMTRNRLKETTGDIEKSNVRLHELQEDQERSKRAQEAAASSSLFSVNGTGSASGIATAFGLDFGDSTREELLQYRRLAQSRLAELEEAQAQRTMLRGELEKIRSQLDRLPDDKIQDSIYGRALLVQIQNVRNEADFYRSEVLRMRAELEDLRVSRRKFMDALEAEEKNRRAALEAEVKKLENDISRVRDSRDRFQQMYENRCAKDEYELQQNQEIRKIANSRKDRITALSADIQRLQTLLSSDSKDKDTFAFYLKGENSKNSLKESREKLKHALERIRLCSMELEATKQATLQERDLEAITASEQQLQEQVEHLSSRITQLETVVGLGAKDETKELVRQIDEKDEAILRLELLLQAHEAVQAPLLNELHTVATAWGQLEEATSRKVIDLAQKEDLIFKLLSDKTRQEAKCNNLIRAKEQSSNMTAVMRRQSDMQQDQIRRLEEREKNLNDQMIVLEKEQTTMNDEIMQHKFKVQEYTQQNTTFKDKFSRQEERLAELQGLLKERTEAYENETATRKRLIEEADGMKKKLEEQAKKSSEGPGDSEAAKQAAGYLKLLKCPACDVNFKSHVILRCMHVFCKSCMDKQMEYRQRKCPTCRENFGAKDVKEIYL